MTRWIPVLVRLEDLEAVSRFIGGLESSRTDDQGDEVTQLVGSQSVAEATSDVGADGLTSRVSWSYEDLERLAKGETATTARWTRALDVCAAVPETFLPTSEIAKRSGMSIAEWRDAPRKITRHLKANYPNVPRDENGDAYWPLQAKSVPEYPGEVSWAITSDMARLWKQVRS